MTLDLITAQGLTFTTLEALNASISDSELKAQRLFVGNILQPEFVDSNIIKVNFNKE